jgi:hypothetical protein
VRKPISEQERKRRRKKQRGVPPPPTFSLSELPDDGLLTQKEVAAWTRQSVTWAEKLRYEGRDRLEWVYFNGKPRCTVKSLKQVLQNNSTERRRVAEPFRKKSGS